LSLGRPSITTPPQLELRGVQAAIANTRQRIEAIEQELARVAGQSGQTAYAGGSASSVGSSAAITALQAALATLSARVTVLEALVDGIGAGIVVGDGLGNFTVRTLVAGTNITITNGTGVSGNPIISAAGGRGEYILDEDDERLLTEDRTPFVVE
jgi:hypothetical protein